MARPRTITDEQIVEAAREVFLEQGFAATTAEIARRAGISEGTLFKRYASKEDLFEAAVGLRDHAHWRTELIERLGSGEVRRNLEWAFMEFLKEAAAILPNLMTILSRGHNPEHNRILERLGNPMRRDTEVIARYLRAELDLGRVRPLDAEVTALTVVGALTNYVHQEHMLAPTDREPLDSGRFVRGLLDLLWPGLAP
ncbi:TetR/AcrR family transcriptional regulator [Deinococcus arenicola]|uniref:Helix-turn-helix domain containing protein n=1 Tax=Deinococcus arenicola TaxID=2994950 RepID=A0ABU4DT42_9DEIO|nr:helix-turn-helix domain-containing protein [Deinococcus sp. ZS9-10]MDV6375595.1 helix-turn-helix domain containing protein [Deinococcus sp. ZS9-10]